MDPAAIAFSLLGFIGSLIGVAAKLTGRWEERRRRITSEDWLHWANTKDGKVLMRDYIHRLMRDHS